MVLAWFAHLLLVLGWLPTAQARPTEASLPTELQPWVGWVEAAHPELRCPVVAGEAACLWPGLLELDVEGGGGRFSYAVRVDRELDAPLPGGEGAWPLDLRVDGERGVVVARAGSPWVRLSPGEHRLSGRFRWDALPPTIRMPASVGRVGLRVRGEVVPWPHLDPDGTLRLGAGEVGAAEASRVELDVSRRIQDGVPVVVTTRIGLRSAGASREIDLGAVLLSGTRAVSLQADLPARFTEGGGLVVQVRPGTWTVTVEAVLEGPAADLEAPAATSEVWPEREYWAVQQDDRVRAVNLSGPPSVDPARTSLPEGWRGLPTYVVEPGQRLHFEELRRGEAEPAPNQLTLNRELWLDEDGGGLTVRDHFGGTMNQGWRLEMLAPGEPGHVSDQGVDQVITKGVVAGVELRSQSLGMVAESRITPLPAALPAVGWNTDVHRLSATLHLPPGWTLLHAWGVDSTSGSLVDEWSLFDLFFVLVVSLGLSRLWGWRWGLVTVVGLASTRHVADAPGWSFAALMGLQALGSVLPKGRLEVALRWLRGGLLLVVLLVLVPFTLNELRTGLFPSLSRPWSQADSLDWLTAPMTLGVKDANAPGGGLVDDLEQRTDIIEVQDVTVLPVTTTVSEAPPPPPPPPPSGAVYGGLDGASVESKVNIDRVGSFSRSAKVSGGRGGEGRWDGSYAQLSLQVDPTAVVQTGPGVPRWSWSSHQLSWSGPVSADHEARLWLLGPIGNLLLGLARVGLLLTLTLRFAGFGGGAGSVWSRWREGASGLLLALFATGLLTPHTAAAAPSPELLAELEARLTAPEDCEPDCISVSSARFRATSAATPGGGDLLTVEAELHAARPGAWIIPGPAATWVPASVLLDGQPSVALQRRPDGFLYLRVPAGVHDVYVEGPLPLTDALTLQLGDLPRSADFAGDGWSLDGIRPDGSTERSFQLTRTRKAAPGEARAADPLSPWLEVRRFLDLGIPWRVRTEVVRVGAGRAPVALKVPLLPGEAVTEQGIQVQGGAALVTLDAGRDSLTWLSTLEEADSLRLVAPSGVPWTEVWTLSCSPVYRCVTGAGGLAPLTHVQAGRVTPEWRPWPGEAVEIAVSRPDPVPGQVITVDAAELSYTPGESLSELTLVAQVRTSQGGRLSITLPEGIRLQGVDIDGVAVPAAARGRSLPIPLRPGSQRVGVRWQQDHEGWLFDRVPEVDLGSPAVNVTVTVHPSPDRWLLALQGPRWGPVPLFWSSVLVVVGAALLLGRALRPAPGAPALVPLGAGDWLLLGLGMTQVPVVVPAVVVLWIVALGWRRRRPPSGNLRPLVQVGLVLLTPIAALCLISGVVSGLVGSPDMDIQGNGSSANLLRWFVDRSAGPLPRPVMVSAPLIAWQAAMLAWSLWLATQLLSWIRWGWTCFSEGGVWTAPPVNPPVNPPVAPPFAPPLPPMEHPTGPIAVGEGEPDDEEEPHEEESGRIEGSMEPRRLDDEIFVPEHNYSVEDYQRPVPLSGSEQDDGPTQMSAIPVLGLPAAGSDADPTDLPPRPPRR